MINKKSIVKKIFPEIDIYDSKVFKKSNLFRLYYKNKLNKQDKSMLKEVDDFYKFKKRGKSK